MKKKSKDCVLFSFKATVVEVEGYKSVIEGNLIQETLAIPQWRC